ncbi:MAG: recombinase family protein, partial [Thermomicrobiales bacterium]
MFVGYARVSTRDQSPALQLQALTEAGCDRVFTEAASGAQRDRPELKAALDFLRPRDTLVVWKLDRLARSVRQLVETAGDLQGREIGLKVLTQQIDTTTPGGRLVFHMFAAIAEFERELTLERTHAGLAVARAAGRRGGGKAPFGVGQVEQGKGRVAKPKTPVEG